MPSKRRSKRVRVALLELPGNLANTLSLFFESRLCPLDVEVVTPERADIGIFDYDHPLSREHADRWLATPDGPSAILLSIQALEKPDAVCLTKPMKPKDLVRAIEDALGDAPPTPTKPASQAPSPQPVEPPSESPALAKTAETLAPPAAGRQAEGSDGEAEQATSPSRAQDLVSEAEPSADAPGTEGRKKPDTAPVIDEPETEARPAAEEAPPEHARQWEDHGETSTASDNVVDLITPASAPRAAPQPVPEPRIAPDIEKLLEEVNWQLDFGDIDKAREMLENALEANPAQSILHHEILQLYGWTSDQEHFYSMYEKLDMKHVPNAEKWVKLKEFFDRAR